MTWDGLRAVGLTKPDCKDLKMRYAVKSIIDERGYGAGHEEDDAEVVKLDADFMVIAGIVGRGWNLH